MKDVSPIIAAVENMIDTSIHKLPRFSGHKKTLL
jgi:hypothetical protein